MNKYTASTYGDSVADIYDQLYGDIDQDAVSILIDLAQGGRALELGIGTGRMALPLYHAGLEIQGIDASHAMTDKLKAKPGGQDIPILHGDFAEFNLEVKFDLIYVVFNLSLIHI